MAQIIYKLSFRIEGIPVVHTHVKTSALKPLKPILRKSEINPGKSEHTFQQIIVFKTFGKKT